MAILDRLISLLTMSQLICFTETMATSGTCSLMSPAVARRIFFTNLSRILRLLLVMLAGLPEPFFSFRDGTGREVPSLGEEPFDVGAVAAKAVSDNTPPLAKTQYLLYLPWKAF